jgi:hypothetical protein
MRIGRGNRSTRRKPVPVPLCPPQISNNLSCDRTRAAAVGSRRLTAWSMARPFALLTLRPWKWRRYNSPKLWLTFIRLNGVISQKKELFMLIPVERLTSQDPIVSQKRFDWEDIPGCMAVTKMSNTKSAMVCDVTPFTDVLEKCGLLALYSSYTLPPATQCSQEDTVCHIHTVSPSAKPVTGASCAPRHCVPPHQLLSPRSEDGHDKTLTHKKWTERWRDNGELWWKHSLLCMWAVSFIRHEDEHRSKRGPVFLFPSVIS